ncbi:hypothetical protein INN71_07995 [Nocardioides sp. ChNu-153]|uniref:hypothetical protein n=1 Tax=unclassified Nocardioides TaxID=2615069 RepID=UPI002405809B|nr:MULTISPECIES: hypothetical protein [unclassified Nocardioides]MDF9716775.1 hypothetical protein [Nocardioides sp. ChNu-99]MDN7121333.1 hypothetical protein [Nocardioides sp. ChNu-153]
MYLEFFSDDNYEPLWQHGPGPGDVGPADTAELGLSDGLLARLRAWCVEASGGPMRGGLLDHHVRALELARLVQLEFGDEHEVWRLDGPGSRPLVLAGEGEGADLARTVAGRPVAVPLRQVSRSTTTHRRIVQWRRARLHARAGTAGTAAWRAEGLAIAARLQEEVGLDHAVTYLGGRTERP